MLNSLFRSIRRSIQPSIHLVPSLAAFVLPIACVSTPVFSHEFWIEPEKYQVDSGASLQIGLRNGQMFKGARLPYLEKRIQRFDWALGSEIWPYQGRLGDMPAMVLRDLPPGLAVVLHETRPETITYDTWEEFEALGADKGFPDLRDRHQARGLPMQGFVERYSRHAKLLLGIDHARGRDRAFGLETEFIALANPYDLSGVAEQTTLPVQLFYQGNPRPHAQVEVFERPTEGEVQRRLVQTDAKGEVRIALRRGHSYLLNAVVLRPVDDDPAVVWETLWASLSFAAP